MHLFNISSYFCQSVCTYGAEALLYVKYSNFFFYTTFSHIVMEKTGKNKKCSYISNPDDEIYIIREEVRHLLRQELKRSKK